MDRLRAAVLTVGGSGYAPFASGSWGSLAALVLYLGVYGLLSTLGVAAWREGALCAGALLGSGAAVAWGNWAVRTWRSSDPKPFVIDEFVGQWLALLLIPIGASHTLHAVVIAGQFLFFRVFDVLKPPPARQLESLPGGWGILLDDVAAGIMANLTGQVLWRLTPAAALLGLA